MSQVKAVEIIDRKTAEKTVLTGEGHLSISVSAPSVIKIHGFAHDVIRYIRQGKDLLIYMEDGSVIRCINYFAVDPDTQKQSELVFDDGQQLTHISFAETSGTEGFATTVLTAQEELISNIEPFLEHHNLFNDIPWEWAAGAAIGGGALGALLAHRGKGDTTVIDNTKEIESATPTFLVTDKVGDQQGVLRTRAVTDDNTPTFEGTGQPGATIQVKDSGNNSIASTVVGKNGIWTLKLPVQSDGEHTWSVVQIDGSKATLAGNITLTIATADAVITLATTAHDNIINATEHLTGFTLSGASTHLPQGTELTITLNGKTYITPVGSNGEWDINVPATSANALTDGTWTINVSGRDAAGNTITGSQTIIVDTVVPSISVNTLAQDNIINAVEHSQPLTLTGTTDAEAGQVVTITINNNNHTAVVGSDGEWSVTLSASEVEMLADGNHSLIARVSDLAGNEAHTTKDFSVDTVSPIITVNTVAGDNTLNTAEQGQAQLISGFVSGAASGDVVTMTVGDKIFTGIVQFDGSWSIGVPASATGALGEGKHAISVSVTDAAGNIGNATHGIILSGYPPEFTIDAISQDNVLNAQEAMQPLILSGTSNMPDGSSVFVTLNNVNYQTTVDNGIWSVSVPVSDVMHLANTLYNVNVRGIDSAGNSGSTEAILLVDTTLPQIIINTFAGNDLVNNTEIAVDQALSGHVAGVEEGASVTISVEGKNYTTTVSKDLTWTLSIPSADLKGFGDGELTFIASVTNIHGNTGTNERSISINAERPGLRVNTISGDDVINILEQYQDLSITGSSTHLVAGTQVIVTINDIHYLAVINDSGNWQIGVPSADLQQWSAGKMTVTVTAEDRWGNTTVAKHPLELDLNPTAIIINPVTSDDILNAIEKDADLILSGQTQGVDAGQTVVIKFSDQLFTTVVQQDGSWDLTVPTIAMSTLIDGRAQVSARVTNIHGNSASAAREYRVDTLAPSLTIDTIATDDIVNAQEAQSDLTIGGTSTAEQGQQVTVNVNGKTYTTTVDEQGRWTLAVPAADLTNFSDGSLTVRATVNDIAGNPAVATHQLIVDVSVPVITINTVAGDDIINVDEQGQAQIISGTASGAARGDSVTVTVGSYTATTILDAAGQWRVGVPASVISQWRDGTVTVLVSVTDAAGNTGHGHHDIRVDTGLPSLDFATISGDNVLNAQEKGQDLLVEGTSAQVAEGALVTVTLNGVQYTATTQADGAWRLVIPTADLQELGEANYTLSATTTNQVGNSISTAATLRVDTGLPIVTINPIATDNVINAADVAAGQTLSGQALRAAAGDRVTVTLGGHDYLTQVEADLSWSVKVPAEVLTALGNGELTVTASVTNGYGNTGVAARDIVIDAHLPGLRVDTVAGDDVINRLEQGQNLILTGSSDGLATETVLTVTVNGKTYSAVVQADGRWHTALPAADLAALSTGTVTVTVSGQSRAGNPVTIVHPVTVDLAEVAISIDTLAGDDVINAAEKGADLTLSGSTTGVEAGQKVSVRLGGSVYTTEVDNEGHWQVTAPAANLSGLKDGESSVLVSVSNLNGNSASAAREYRVDTQVPIISLDPITADNIINSGEAALGVVISGWTTAEVGQTVTLMFGESTYIAEVQQGGYWSLQIPSSKLEVLDDKDYIVEVSVNDMAGNTGAVSKIVTLDTTVPVIRFNSVASDDVINSAEHLQAQIVSGTAVGADVGDKILIVIGSNKYTTTVDALGHWSIGVPARTISALQDGQVTISATITDSAGNSSTKTHDIVVNTAPVSLIMAPIATDNVINAIEAESALVISGSSAQFDRGTQVTVSLNGKSYNTNILSDGSWKITLPVADTLALSEDVHYQVSAYAQDSAGNNASTMHSIRVDTTAPVISISTISDDNVLNALEMQQSLTIQGTSSAETGQLVTVMLGGHIYTAAIANNGTWTLTVPTEDVASLSEGSLAVSASVNDKAGNNSYTTQTLTVSSVVPTVTINTVAGDDIINNNEQQTGQILSGSTSAEQGQIVNVMFSGHNYQATVDQNGEWSVFVAGRDFLGLMDGSYTVTASVSDKAGNLGHTTHNVTLSGDIPSISINRFAEDDVVNAQEHAIPLVISGTTTAPAGQTVTLALNDKVYTTFVKSDGTWSYTLGRADVALLMDGSAYAIQAQVSNTIGNYGRDDRTITVDLSAPTMNITIDSLQNDTGLSASDFITNDNKIVINGSLSAQLGSDEKAQLSFDNGANWINLSVVGTHWRYADTRLLADGTYQYQVRVIDDAGNIGTTDSQDIVVDLTAPIATTITVDAVTQDTGVSNSDFITSDQQITLQGEIDALLASGDHVQISVDGGMIWHDVNVSGLKWTYIDDRTLADGDHNYQLRIIDNAGNISATTHQVVTVDTAAPEVSKTVSIDSISDDTGLNNRDFITNDISLTLHGSLGATLGADEFVQISLDGGTAWQNVTLIGHTWYYVDGRTLENKTYDYWVRVIDTAGNVGASAHQQVIVDTVAPDESITVTVDNITVDSGFDNHDFLTQNTSYTLHGTLGAELGQGEYVQVSFDDGATWFYAMVDGNHWHYAETRTLTDGEYTYQVRVVDQAGNVGVKTSKTVTVDTLAPQYGITIDAISEDTGQLGHDFITNDPTLTVSGTLGKTLASDERVQISLDQGHVWIDVNVINNQWNYADTRYLSDGNYTYQVRIIDQAGNVGSTAQQVVIVDTVAPTTQGTIVSYSDSQGERQGNFSSSIATDETMPKISGVLNQALATGEIAELYRDGVLLGRVTMRGPTDWVFQDSDLKEGHHTYVIRITDVAGNYTDSSHFVLTVDTRIPTTTVAITPQTTTDTTPILKGTVSAELIQGEYLVISVNGKTYTSEAGGAVVVDPQNKTWYVQIPNNDALALKHYDITAQVKSSAGNGNTLGITKGSVQVNQEESFTTSWSFESTDYAYSSSYMLDQDGRWSMIANQQIASGDASSRSTYRVSSPFSSERNYSYTTGTYADINRDGYNDVLAEGDSYTYMAQLTNNGDGTYTYTKLDNSVIKTAVWYGAVVAIDIQGDGYTDFVIGDAGGPDSSTFMLNDHGTLQGSVKAGAYTNFVSGSTVGNYYSLIEASGVDLNNDGKVDIAQHTNNARSEYSLSTMLNQGNGSFTWGQNFTDTMYSRKGKSAADDAVSMTWADFNGDGYMDLYMSMSRTSTGTSQSGLLMLNDKTGNLLAGTTVGTTSSDQFLGSVSVAVDWDHDGKMDIIKLANSGQSYLYTNTGSGSIPSFMATKFSQSLTSRVSGAALLDYDWDGAQDLLIFQQNGQVLLERNTNTVAAGKSLHLKIADSEGIDAFFGNTVQLYNSAGKLVASEIINAQSGIGINDSSSLVSFYGLNPSDTYRAVLIRAINGVSSAVTWNGLTTGDSKDSYSLTAEAATGKHSGLITGTGYNDTFIATDGTYTYNGSGGWATTSQHSTWDNKGGMDVVDYRNATSGITIDLGITTAQSTGYNTTTLKNIEGIAGSHFNDVITGSSGDNQFEGRGGNDVFNIGNGGHDTLLYKLINASDATGGNGSDVVNGFTVGTREGTADTDRIDLRDLLSNSGYTGTGSASYINGVATLDGGAGNIADYIRVVKNGSNTEIQIDRDGTEGQFESTTIVTLNGVQTDLATLLANHQLLLA